MHDTINLVMPGVDPRQSLHGLPEVAQVGLNEGAESLAWAHSIHVDDLVAMLQGARGHMPDPGLPRFRPSQELASLLILHGSLNALLM